MIVCADDFGWSDDVNLATLELVDAGRVSAVSCMVVMPHCDRQHLTPLLARSDRIDIGVHLTITDRFLSGRRFDLTAPVRAADFGSILVSSVLGRFRPTEVVSEVREQYELFRKKTGRHPDFLDGHFHAHQFPNIAEGLVQFVEALSASERPYIRNTHMPFSKIKAQGISSWKSVSISVPGTRFRRKLEKKRVATNDGFAGVYAYRDWPRYPEFLRGFVSHMESGNGLLMVHPGREDRWRRAECEALLDAEFIAGVVGRFRR